MRIQILKSVIALTPIDVPSLGAYTVGYEANRRGHCRVQHGLGLLRAVAFGAGGVCAVLLAVSQFFLDEIAPASGPGGYCDCVGTTAKTPYTAATTTKTTWAGLKHVSEVWPVIPALSRISRPFVVPNFGVDSQIQKCSPDFEPEQADEFARRLRKSRATLLWRRPPSLLRTFSPLPYWESAVSISRLTRDKRTRCESSFEWGWLLGGVDLGTAAVERRSLSQRRNERKGTPRQAGYVLRWLAGPNSFSGSRPIAS